MSIDWKKMEKAMADILAELRESGTIDLHSCLHDKVRQGAMAELEHGGWILRAGPPDPSHRQPFYVASTSDEREEFRAIFRSENDKAMWKVTPEAIRRQIEKAEEEARREKENSR